MKKNGAKASITIYMSLVLVLTLALLCTLCESGRVSAIEARLRSIMFMAADSVFAGYAEPLFEEYGVMFLWMDEEEITDRFEGFVAANLSAEGLDYIGSTDLYGMSLRSCSLTGLTKATDQGGKVFLDQASEFMEYMLAEELAAKLLENVGIFNQSDKVDKFMDKVESFAETFKKVEKSVSKIKTTIDKLKAIARDPKLLLEQMQGSLEQYAISGDESDRKDFDKVLQELKKTKNQMEGYMQDIKSQTDKYYEYVEEAHEAIDELEDDLGQVAPELEDDVYEAVNEQVTDLKQKSADSGYDYYKVGRNLTVTDGYLKDLSQLDDLFDKVKEIEKADAEEEEASEEERLRGVVKEYEEKFSGFNVDNLWVDYNSGAIEEESDGFIAGIKRLFNKGILGFVAGDVSEKKIETSQLPSKTVKKDGKDDEKENLLEAGAKKALFGEYILDYFGNFTNVLDETALDYEAEYVLGGKPTDEQNLSVVVAEIVGLRTGCNLISLLKSPQKKEETLALATSLVGFVGQPIVIKVMQILLIATWALAESMMDVKALLSGHKIKTIKDADDWYISLAGLKNFGADSLSAETDVKAEAGLDYEAYLRILLLMQGQRNQTLRTMDMVQADICLRTNKSFRFEECASAASFAAEFEAPRLFVAMPIVTGPFGESEGSYVYQMSQEYAY